ncbi:MAG: hypothetical protein KIG95_04710 [Comamonas sp.]|nr:hypothetical protein [Comamonas sp.]
MPHPPTPAAPVTPAQAAAPLHQQPSFNTRLEQVLLRTAQALALGGGILFVGLIAMSLVSIVGRKLGFGSVNGDIELMQAGTAVAAVAHQPSGAGCL